MWNRLDKPLVLASNSPRRRELLSVMGFSFMTAQPRISDEESYFGAAPVVDSVRELAMAKAQSVAEQYPDHLVFAGDTVVCAGEHLMGKPRSRHHAREMLRELSGKTHEVLSGIGLIDEKSGFSGSASARTEVSFRDLSEEEIEAYLDAGDYLDKAGAYGIQGAAMTLVERIDGCFYNVVGLPVAETIRLFKAYQRRKECTNA